MTSCNVIIIIQVYIPELGMTFKVPVKSRIFVCQNPLQQGGGRKGLPKSFLNRFTQVHREPIHVDGCNTDGRYFEDLTLCVRGNILARD